MGHRILGQHKVDDLRARYGVRAKQDTRLEGRQVQGVSVDYRAQILRGTAMYRVRGQSKAHDLETGKGMSLRAGDGSWPDDRASHNA